jgi:maleylacetoacetate isomerase
MKLYTYFRSSAAYRTRIALNLKGVEPEQAFIHLQKNEQRAADYLKLNPQGLVPALVDGEHVITQSLAIIEYLDETHPEPPLLPGSASDRARIRAIALAIACDIHPIDNLRVLRYLTNVLGVSEEDRNKWFEHWIREGLTALEAQLAQDPRTGRFCHGDAPTLADICLVPQLANARRVNMDIGGFPTIARIEVACQALPAFANAAPMKQPDAA